MESTEASAILMMLEHSAASRRAARFTSAPERVFNKALRQ